MRVYVDKTVVVECACGWRGAARHEWLVNLAVWWHVWRSPACRRGGHGMFRLVLERLFRRRFPSLR